MSELHFESLYESHPVPVIPEVAGAATTTTVQAVLLVDERGSRATVFVGNGGGPQLTPAAARSLAGALHVAADVAESGARSA